VSIRAHPLLAIGTAILVLVGGSPIAWLKGAPKYHAEATVQIAPRYMKNLRDDQELLLESNAQYRQFVNHHARWVTRYDVIQRALSPQPPYTLARERWMREGETERNAIARLQAALVVQSVPDTYLIRIALDDQRAGGLAEVVNAVTRAYLDISHSERLYNADARMESLSKRELELQAKIDEKSTQRNAISHELSLTSFSENVTNPFDKLVADQRHALQEATRQRLLADAAFDVFRRRGDTHIKVRSVSENVLNDPGLNSLKSTLSNRVGVLATQISGLQPDHPGYLAARRELKELEQLVSSHDARLEAPLTWRVRWRKVLWTISRRSKRALRNTRVFSSWRRH
jgi:succinoglycan biosynthesis transport protein ExoP